MDDAIPSSPVVGLPAGTAPQLLTRALPHSGCNDVRGGKPAIRIGFSFGEVPVICDVASGDDTVSVEIQALFGEIPFSIQDRVLRKRLLGVMDDVVGASQGRIQIDARQSIIFRKSVPVAAPLTATKLLTTLVIAVLEMRSFADLLSGYLPELGAALPRIGAGAVGAP